MTMEKYIAEITRLMEKSHDDVLLDFILKLLQAVSSIS